MPAVTISEASPVAAVEGSATSMPKALPGRRLRGSASSEPRHIQHAVQALAVTATREPKCPHMTLKRDKTV